MAYENITCDVESQYTPCAAIIAYKNDRLNNYLLESHRIDDKGMLGAAHPVSQEFMNTIAGTFSVQHSKTPHGRIPANLLYADYRSDNVKLLWWTPPGPRRMAYSDRSMPDGEYNMPGTVYMVDGQLYVFAFKGNKPDMKHKLLYGPFYNYYDNHSMCLGNARLDLPSEITWEKLLIHWENIFWNTINSHTICNPMNDKHILCHELKKSMTQPFDTATLRKSTFSIDNLIDRLDNANKNTAKY